MQHVGNSDYGAETGVCDSCEDSFSVDELRDHEDGNTYCQGCNYLTKQDRMDAFVDCYGPEDL